MELRLGSPAVDLDPAGHELTLGTGERLGYDKLLLATGSSARRLPGTDLDGLYYLRDVQDADRLRAALTVGGRTVVVVGAGWIGMEAAAAARGHGNEVTVVEPAGRAAACRAGRRARRDVRRSCTATTASPCGCGPGSRVHQLRRRRHGARHRRR